MPDLRAEHLHLLPIRSLNMARKTLLAVLLAACTLSRVYGASYQEDYEEGSRLLKKGEFGAARTSFTDALRVAANQPEISAAQLGVAFTWVGEGKLKEAVEAFQAVARMTTAPAEHRARACIGIAQCLSSAGAHEEAARQYQIVLDMQGVPEPLRFDVLLGRAGELDALDQHAEAAAAYLSALAMPGLGADQKARADIGLARARLGEGNLKAAEDLLKGVLAVPGLEAQRLFEARFWLGEALLADSQFDAARKEWEAIAAAADAGPYLRWRALMKIGDACEKQNRLDDAAAAWRRAIDVPGIQPMWLNYSRGELAALLARTGRAREAMKLYEQIAADTRTHPQQRCQALLKAGDALSAAREFGPAQAAYARALDLKGVPPSMQGYALLRSAVCNRNLWKYDKAMQDLERLDALEGALPEHQKAGRQIMQEIKETLRMK